MPRNLKDKLQEATEKAAENYVSESESSSDEEVVIETKQRQKVKPEDIKEIKEQLRALSASLSVNAAAKPKPASTGRPRGRPRKVPAAAAASADSEEVADDEHNVVVGSDASPASEPKIIKPNVKENNIRKSSASLGQSLADLAKAKEPKPAPFKGSLLA